MARRGRRVRRRRRRVGRRGRRVRRRRRRVGRRGRRVGRRGRRVGRRGRRVRRRGRRVRRRGRRVGRRGRSVRRRYERHLFWSIYQRAKPSFFLTRSKLVVRTGVQRGKQIAQSLNFTGIPDDSTFLLFQTLTHRTDLLLQGEHFLVLAPTQCTVIRVLVAQFRQLVFLFPDSGPQKNPHRTDRNSETLAPRAGFLEYGLLDLKAFYKRKIFPRLLDVTGTLCPAYGT